MSVPIPPVDKDQNQSQRTDNSKDNWSNENNRDVMSSHTATVMTNGLQSYENENKIFNSPQFIPMAYNSNNNFSEQTYPGDPRPIYHKYPNPPLHGQHPNPEMNLGYIQRPPSNQYFQVPSHMIHGPPPGAPTPAYFQSQYPIPIQFLNSNLNYAQTPNVMYEPQNLQSQFDKFQHRIPEPKNYLTSLPAIPISNQAISNQPHLGVNLDTNNIQDQKQAELQYHNMYSNNLQNKGTLNYYSYPQLIGSHDSNLPEHHSIHLHPLRTAVPWTAKESKLLMKLRERGLTWKDIASKFPNRTLNACQFRWKRISMNGGIENEHNDSSEDDKNSNNAPGTEKTVQIQEPEKRSNSTSNKNKESSVSKAATNLEKERQVESGAENAQEKSVGEKRVNEFDSTAPADEPEVSASKRVKIENRTFETESNVEAKANNEYTQDNIISKQVSSAKSKMDLNNLLGR